jgi:hypothetical protein
MDNIEFVKKNLGKECHINEFTDKGMIVGYRNDEYVIIGFYTYDIDRWGTDPYTDDYDGDKLVIHSPIIKSYWYTTQDDISIIE